VEQIVRSAVFLNDKHHMLNMWRYRRSARWRIDRAPIAGTAAGVQVQNERAGCYFSAVRRRYVVALSCLISAALQSSSLLIPG